MPSDLSKNIIKLIVALIKHQAVNILGKDTISIAAQTLIDIGGEKTQGAIESILITNAGSQQLIDAALRADEFFRARCEDQDLREAFTLTVGSLPTVQMALRELPQSLDQSNVSQTIGEILARDFPKLTQEQIEKGKTLYVESLNRALLPLQDFTLSVIGNAVLESREDIREIKANVRKLLQNNSFLSPSLSKANIFQPEIIDNLDAVPEPKGLPLGSRILFHRNAVFTGRGTDLKLIAKDLLLNSNSLVITQPTAAIGMGGVGKTQLAVEFCYRYGRYFYGVHWIDARANIDSEIAACGLAMGIPNFSEKIQEQVFQTLEIWQQQSLRLVVLDNLDDPLILRRLLSKLNNIRILVTSRRMAWSADLGLHTHSLDIFDRGESVLMLRKLAPRLKDVSDDEIDSVADKLGDLPLALDLAGRYLNDRPDVSPSVYIQKLNDAGNILDHASLLNWVKGDSPTNHETSVALTFLLSWERLEKNEVDEIAKLFFAASGYLAPNVPIPRNIYYALLRAWAKRQNGEIARSDSLEFVDYSEASDLADASILRLQNLGLIDQSVSLHPLLVEFSRSQRKFDDEIVADISSSFIAYAYDFETHSPTAFMPVRHHIEVFINHITEKYPLLAVRMSRSLGLYLNTVAEYSEAIIVFTKAKNILENVEELDHQLMVYILIGLGMSYMDIGDYQKATEFVTSAREIAARHFPNTRDELLTMNNLGLLLAEQGFISEAVELFQKIIDSPLLTNEFSGTLSNLGGAFYDQGRFNEAKTAYEKAVEYDLELVGENHLITARDYNNLGLVLKDLNQLELAKEYLEKSLKIRRNIFGERHPQTSSPIGNLGLVYQLLNNHDKAEECFRLALSIEEEAFGRIHPSVAKQLFNLHSVFLVKGKLQEAVDIITEVLTIETKIYGKYHLEVARDLRTLALTYMMQKEIKLAKQTAKKALYVDKKCPSISLVSIGEDHYVLGCIYLANDESWEASQELRKALEYYEKELPENNQRVKNAKSVLFEAIRRSA